MNVCVVGLWHLGTVTAACLASVGHNVVGLDFDSEVIEQLRQGQPPLFEPGLEELVQQGQQQGNLCFTTNSAEALAEAEIVWIAYDTPVDDQDQADVAFVIEQVNRIFSDLRAGTLILISSQLPIGTTKHLENSCADLYPDKSVSFAYSPENLRLGKAIAVFTQPDRIVVGVRNVKDQERIQNLLQPITNRVEWMSVESAEMTKHALNAFLATSVTFINEVATLCEQVGADAKEVERGLKSEARIGPKAYLGPGAAFAGGTLARDIAFLKQIGEENQQPTHLLSAVQTSNNHHKSWIHHRLLALLDQNLKGKTVAIWGLTYKPGTNTLRRSSSVELCEWLAEQGARVQAHDPAIQTLPSPLAEKIALCSTATEALAGASALVIATGWPDYRAIEAQTILSVVPSLVVIDPNRFLAANLDNQPHIQYIAVGKGVL